MAAVLGRLWSRKRGKKCRPTATKLFTFAVGILFGVAAAAALRGALAVWISQWPVTPG
jgi:hypothetical protein